MKRMRKIEINVESGALTDDQKEKIIKFLDLHHDVNVNMLLTPVDSAFYWMHKYYRGYLLPSIIDCTGDTGSHDLMKKRFLMYDIYSLDDVLSHHRSKCVIFLSSDHLPVSCLPSTAVLTSEEYIKFINDCKFFLFDTVGGHILPYYQEKAHYAWTQIQGLSNEC